MRVFCTHSLYTSALSLRAQLHCIATMADVTGAVTVKQEPGAPVASSSSAPAATAAGSGKSSGARVRVKKWSGVAFWSYDIENDTCAIW